MQAVEAHEERSMLATIGLKRLAALSVVVVVMLLAAWVAANFVHKKERVRIDATEGPGGPQSVLLVSLALYRMHVGEYPDTLERLHTAPEDKEKAMRWRGPYVARPSVLKDAWGHDVHYRYPGEVVTDGFDLWSGGPDGVSGTGDDVVFTARRR